MSTIKDIARNNGYKDNLVDDLRDERKSIDTIHKIYPKVDENIEIKFSTATYFGPVSSAISRILRNDQFNIAFKPSQKLSNILYNA